MKFKDFKNYIDDLEKKTEESNASFQKAKNLEAILSITKRINQFLILEDVLKSVLKHAIEINSTDRGFIVLRDKNDELTIKWVWIPREIFCRNPILRLALQL